MNQIQTLQQTYGDCLDERLDLVALTGALSRWYATYTEHNFLHPCIIAEQPALVCQRDLSRNNPPAYDELAAIALEFGLYLKEDSRSRQLPGHPNRRRQIGMILSFCAGLAATPQTTTADSLTPVLAASASANLAPVMTTMQATVVYGTDHRPVIQLRHRSPPTAAQVLTTLGAKADQRDSDPAAETFITEFLTRHYQAAVGDPKTIKADFASLAAYFARYPQIIDLIKALRDQNLTLQYRAETWQTEALGNPYEVNHVIVYFDSRMGAQLLYQPGCETTPACSISPADALLHELLHAKLMLLDSEHFLATGAMNSLYPAEHEREVISAENRLYDAMNQQDGLSRPLRHRHAGELLQVACPACIPVKHLDAQNAEINLSLQN